MLDTRTIMEAWDVNCITYFVPNETEFFLLKLKQQITQCTPSVPNYKSFW